MAGKHTLVLDAGTSEVRAHIFDMGGRLVASSAIPWVYKTSEDTSSLAREFESEALWRDVQQTVSQVVKRAKVPASEIAAISITSQRQGLALLDRKGRELYLGPNVDLRAVFKGGEIDERLGERVYQVTGHFPSFLLAPAKLRWFQAHQPQLHDRIAQVCTLGDWLGLKLTGTLTSETTLAGEAGLLDIKERDWCYELLEELGIAHDMLPPLIPPETTSKPLSKSLAKEWGLSEGIPVVIAGADTQCGLLGLGALSEGTVGIVAGWSLPLQMVTSKPMFSREQKAWVGCHLTADCWVAESNAGNIGNTYGWLREMLFANDEEAYSRMDSLAQATPQGAEGVWAFLGPPVVEMTRLGIRPGGIVFPTPLSFAPPERGHLVRAALESYAYAIKANLARLEEVTGIKASSLRVGGGMINTCAFVEILVDVLGCELQVSGLPQASALGAAICGAVALGTYTSLKEGASAVSLRTLEPDPLRSAQYQDLYQQWLSMSKGLEGLGL